jgi:flagellar FliJ protein
LQAVLRHRKAVEQEKLRDLAMAAARLKEAQDELAALDESMRATNDDVRRNRLTGRLDVGFIVAHRRYLLGMQRKALELAAKIAAAQKIVDTARAALAEAAKQRMVLEKLREKQETRWREEIERRELAQLDEVGMQMSVQEMMSGKSNSGKSNEVTS